MHDNLDYNQVNDLITSTRNSIYDCIYDTFGNRLVIMGNSRTECRLTVCNTIVLESHKSDDIIAVTLDHSADMWSDFIQLTFTVSGVKIHTEVDMHTSKNTELLIKYIEHMSELDVITYACNQLKQLYNYKRELVREQRLVNKLLGVQ